MPYYVPIPKIIEVHEWRRNGSHPMDQVINNINEGSVVGYSLVNNDSPCPICDKPNSQHGHLKGPVILPEGVCQTRIDTWVCPGDFIETHRNAQKRIIGYSLHKGLTFAQTHQKHITSSK